MLVIINLSKVASVRPDLIFLGGILMPDTKKNGRGGARAGAGRKELYGDQLVTFSVSMPMSAAQWVAQQAQEASDNSDEKISRSRVVVSCLQHFMARGMLPKF